MRYRKGGHLQIVYLTLEDLAERLQMVADAEGVDINKVLFPIVSLTEPSEEGESDEEGTYGDN